MVHINMIAVDGSAMFKYIIKQYGLKILQAVKTNKVCNSLYSWKGTNKKSTITSSSLDV